MPVAYTRDSNGNYTVFDARSILDVSRMRASWARAGLTLHMVWLPQVPSGNMLCKPMLRKCTRSVV